ncbi:hypothetical protein FIBSPDRAFT_665870, partial [Athelia psychrophila]
WPPSPPDHAVKERIVREFCQRQCSVNVEEIGCAVCAQLTLKNDAKYLDLLEYSHLLESSVGGSRIKRKRDSDPVCEVDGPLLANMDNLVCTDCHVLVSKSKTPLLSLANSMWLGEVPEQLKGLSYAEKMLVTRVRHNHCVMRVSSGSRKMSANVITFENPTAYVYDS